MSLFVKICGIRSLEIAQVAIDAGASAIGFVFAESPRRITPREAAVIAASVPKNVATVAVTRHPDPALLAEVFSAFTPCYLQSDAEDFDAIEMPDGCAALPVYREGQKVELSSRRRILFEGRISGSGRTADWGQAKNLSERAELILAGGLSPQNVAAAVDRVRPWGVDVSSGVELSRGVKDEKLIREFIAKARAQAATAAAIQAHAQESEIRN